MIEDKNKQPVFNYGAAYIPVQCITEIFDPDNSLAFGTIFPELVDEFTNYLR